MKTLKIIHQASIYCRYGNSDWDKLNGFKKQVNESPATKDEKAQSIDIINSMFALADEINNLTS